MEPGTSPCPSSSNDSCVNSGTAEDKLTFLFRDLDFKSIDHQTFTAELLDQFRLRGVSDSAICELTVRLREGSVIADVTASSGSLAIQELREKVPSGSISVMGCAVFVTE